MRHRSTSPIGPRPQGVGLRTRLLGVGLALAALAAPAWADDPLPPDLQAAVTAAATTGAPVSELESKAREGLAKGVPPERIAVALKSWSSDWLRAEVALGSSVGGADHDELIAAAAAAVRKGVGWNDLRELASGSSAAESMWTLVDVLNLGISPSSAPHLVELAARSGQPALRLLPEATRASLAQWGTIGAPSHLEDALTRGQLESLTHGNSADAPGHGGDPRGNGADAPGHNGLHGNAGGNGNGNAGGNGNQP